MPSEMLTDAVAMVTQEAELNELRATIELLRQQGHAQLTPLRRAAPLSIATPHRDASDGQSVSCHVVSASSAEEVTLLLDLFVCRQDH